MVKPDIELLFGVAMGGPSGNSGDTIKGQLEGIIKGIEPLKVKVEIDTDGVIKKWSKDLETILGADGKTIDIKVSKIDASAAIAGFKADLQKIVNSVGVDAGMEVIVRAPNIEEIKTDLKQLGENARASATDVDKLTAEMRELRLQAGSISAAYKKITNTTAESVGGLDIAEVTRKYTALQTEIEAMNRVGATSANAHIAKVRELEAEMRKMLATASSGEIDFGPGSDANEAALIRVRNLIADITKNLNEWSAASKGAAQSSFSALSNYRDELSRIETSLNNGTAQKEEFDRSFSRIATGVSSARKEIRAAGEATKSWADKMGGLINKFTSWLSVAEVITTIWHTMQRMADCVVEVDTAMTELKKVTDASDATYDRFLTNATNRARELGTTVADVVNATADFARIGNNIYEASELADAAILYKNVADGITDIGVASENIISTMQVFKDEVGSATSIVDKFNAVGNKYAISSAGIGEALQRSAAALKAGGNTIDQSIAMITAANRVVQAPESVGTTMKTVSMYLRSAKTELEAAGESTEGMAESTSKLRSELLALTGGAVDIQFDDENFKSTYQILKELSDVWSQLTDVSKANILEKIGGKRNANVVAALIENFDEAEEVIKTSADSAGSALAENEKYLDSISGRIEKLKASFEGFSTSVIDSGLAKFFVSLADSILQIATVFSNIAFDNIFTTFSTIATGAGITAFVRSLD
jgi:TP901 family phage tail tape measure protein